jgi:Holliday junction resolvasome RuvABC endonuclease subunit
MKTLSLDLSINCSGWCVSDGDIYLASGFAPQPNIKASLYKRIEANIKLISNLVDQYCIQIVFMEDTAPSGRGKATKMLTENAGIIKYWLFERHIPVGAISITDIKKTVSGKGTSSKEEMIAAVQAAGYPHVVQNDEADAVATWLTSLDKFGIETVNL